jgi:hypothetical protein
MNTQPYVLARAQVICPANALNHHAKIQQHIGQLIQEPEYKEMHVLASLRRVDLNRLFGENQPKEFYLLENNSITYIAMKAGHDTDAERFAVVIALKQQVLDIIFGGLQNFIDDLFKENEKLPQLRMTLLSNPDVFAHNTLYSRLAVLTPQEHAETNIDQKWDTDTMHWVENTDPVEEEVEKPRIQLKDIPLTTRASRQLVRNTIAENREKLEDLYKKWEHADTASFDQWMTEVQGVHMKALADLEGIDKLSDEEYVEAMVTFKKAEAQAYHSQAVKDNKTDMHLFDWVKLQFGEEFSDLGRAAALQELHGLEPGADQSADSIEEDEPGVFLVSFDGTIVESQRPLVGPESPYAMGVIKALQKNGHHVFIMTPRQNEERDDMMKFFDASGFKPTGICRGMWADGELQREDVDFLVSEEEKEKLLNQQLYVDYLIDHRSFGASTVQISGKVEYEPTMYWGDMVQNLADLGYLTEEDVDQILNSLQEQAEQQ